MGTGNQDNVTADVSYAPLTDYWGNSLTATGYQTVTTSGAGLSIATGQNVENFSTNAADHAGLRIRRGDPDALNGNRTLPGVMIFSIGLGDVDAVLLKRIANDPSLTPNPVAAGNLGATSTQPMPRTSTWRLPAWRQSCSAWPVSQLSPRGSQAPAIANRFQHTHSAKKRLARRRNRIRRLLHAYTANPQPTALTSTRTIAGWAVTRIRVATRGLASTIPCRMNSSEVARSHS